MVLVVQEERSEGQGGRRGSEREGKRRARRARIKAAWDGARSGGSENTSDSGRAEKGARARRARARAAPRKRHNPLGERARVLRREVGALRVMEVLAAPVDTETPLLLQAAQAADADRACKAAQHN